jgi:hypothetical protein
VPVGLVLILLACFGVDSLIGLSSVSFPASVACLILLFLALIVIDLVIGDRRTRALVSIIDVPVSSVSWIEEYALIKFQGWICSTLSQCVLHSGVSYPCNQRAKSHGMSSFVLLPLSSPISGVEVGKIIAVFSEYKFHFLCYDFVL